MDLAELDTRLSGLSQSLCTYPTLIVFPPFPGRPGVQVVFGSAMQ
jgi:hypothetical protein